MFSLQLNSTLLATPSDSTLSIDWVSNLFNEDGEFTGSRSYALNLPFCDVNESALKNAHMPENRSARKEVEMLLSLYGMPWKTCLYSFKIGKKAYEGFLKIDSSVVGKQISKKLLPEIFITSAQNDVIKYREIYMGVSPLQVRDNMNAAAQVPGSLPYVFFPVRNEKCFGDTSGAQLPNSIINRWHANGFNWDATVPQKATEFFTPFFYLKYIITEVCKYLGFEASGDLLNDINFEGTVIFNTGLLNHDQLFTGGKIYPARHLPKIPLDEFFKRLRSRLKLAILFDNEEKKVYFNYTSTLLNANSAEAFDLSNKLFSDFEIGSSQEALYEILEQKDEQDLLFKSSAYIPSAFIGKGDESKKVETGIGTCFMKVSENPDLIPAIFRVPAVKQVSNAYDLVASGQEASNPSGYTKNEFGFRLLHYHGMKSDSLGNFYPYAGSDGLAQDALTVLNPNSLWLVDGNRGILTNFHLAWYQFWLRTEPVTFLSYLNTNDLNAISPLKQILIASKQRVRIPALMHRIAFDVDQSRKYIPANITVYPIYKQTAIEEDEFTDFTVTPPINQGTTYVRLKKNLTGEGAFISYKHNNNPVVLLEAHEFIDIQFFADLAGTIPKVVTGLRVYLREEYRGLNAGNYRNNTGFTDVNSGPNGYENIGNVFGNDGYAHTLHYKPAKLFSPKEYFTNTYFIEPSKTNDYIVIY